LAAYLYVSDIPFVGITKNDGRTSFSFRNKNKAENLIADYFSGNASANPRDLFSRFNDLKDLIFSGGKNE